VLTLCNPSNRGGKIHPPACNAATLRAAGPQHAMKVAVEDSFIRKFILGTWDKMWLSEVVIKRRHNTIIVCGIV